MRKKEIYQYDKKIALADERRIGRREGRKEGKLEGIKEGRHTKQISMAIAMKKDIADINLISKYTGLTIDEIRNLLPDGEKL